MGVNVSYSTIRNWLKQTGFRWKRYQNKIPSDREIKGIYSYFRAEFHNF